MKKMTVGFLILILLVSLIPISAIASDMTFREFATLTGDLLLESMEDYNPSYYANNQALIAKMTFSADMELTLAFLQTKDGLTSFHALRASVLEASQAVMKTFDTLEYQNKFFIFEVQSQDGFPLLLIQNSEIAFDISNL